jgi:hypothetical protein
MPAAIHTSRPAIGGFERTGRTVIRERAGERSASDTENGAMSMAFDLLD